MSVWTTRSLEKDRDYIVLQHTLKGVNHTVNGIKFRDGYAVVEKDSKIYYALKKIPVLRAAKEFPLLHLRNLSFITRTSDIRTVYGQDVYAKFVEQENKSIEAKLEQTRLEKETKEAEENQRREEELKTIQETSSETNILPRVEKCCYRTFDGTLCKEDAVDYSPSNYCGRHVIEEPNLIEFGIEKPKFMTKQEKRDFRDKVKTILQKAKSQKKF